jgi:hypothetical protein
MVELFSKNKPHKTSANIKAANIMAKFFFIVWLSLLRQHDYLRG